MYKAILVLFSSALGHYACAQNSSTFIGSRANGLGHASACLRDVWSLFHNTGGLAKLEALQVGFAYEAVPHFSPFNRMAVAGALPVSTGVVGAGVFRFGDDLYNEQLLSLAYANHFGLASLGIKANYIQYNVAGFGRKGVCSVSFGGIAEITSTFNIGAHIININQPDISESEKLPTLLIAGIAYHPTEKVLVVGEVQKDLDYNPTLKAGVEYVVHQKVILRTGFNLEPDAGFFGLGFRPHRFQLDYAFTWLNAVGSKHQASINYTIKAHK